jgi:hypothetical protein
MAHNISEACWLELARDIFHAISMYYMECLSADYDGD